MLVGVDVAAADLADPHPLNISPSLRRRMS
jgi:hypothetical protein